MPPAPATESVPSRFVAGNLEEHIIGMRRKLSINRSDRGPFGLSQVPGEAPAMVAQPMFKRKAVTPFADIINAINISVVYQAEQEFMVKSQIFRLNQVFTIPTQNGPVNCQVASVRASRVGFKNMKSGEVAYKRLDLLPPGVEVGGGPNSVPAGVTPAGGNKPAVLHIDFLTPPPTP